MRCSVFGMSHLGYVTGACLASWGHTIELSDVVKLAPPPEPGLQTLLSEMEEHGKLTYRHGTGAASASDVLWIALDMPLNEDCSANLAAFYNRIEAAVESIPPHSLVVLSSQLPVGTCEELYELYPDLHFAYIPENLRRGQAIANFTDPDYIIVGTNLKADYQRIRTIYPETFSNRILWTSPASAEMTKHAVNAYLGMCIVFANTLADICADFNIDYSVIEHRLRQDRRIGKHAYLRAGKADATHLIREYWNLTQLSDNLSPFLNVTRDALLAYSSS